VKETLQLAFLTSLNKTVHIAIPNPVQPVSDALVNAAMDAIVKADIFAFPTGRIVKKVSAKLNTATVDPLALS
jgi:hypothetical protein